MAQKVGCFGFFVGDETCRKCAAAKQCKAIEVTTGFDVASAVLDELVATLPEDATFLVDREAMASSDPEEVRGAFKQIYQQLVKPETKPKKRAPRKKAPRKKSMANVEASAL